VYAEAGWRGMAEVGVGWDSPLFKGSWRLSNTVTICGLRRRSPSQSCLANSLISKNPQSVRKPSPEWHFSLYNRLHITSLDTETHLACGLLGS
jgi:hypothetical protein